VRCGRRFIWGAESSFTAGSVYVGVESFLGPIFLGYGMAEGGNDMFYLQLGSTFE